MLREAAATRKRFPGASTLRQRRGMTGTMSPIGRVSRRLGALGIVAAVGCQPRVSAEIVVEEPAPKIAAIESESGPRASDADFDVARALDVSERLLLGVDQLRRASSRRAGDFDYDAAQTWLPDEGLRSLYHHAASLGEGSLLAMVGELFEAPVFMAGPHVGELDLSAPDFGRYDPVFVARVAQTAAALGQDRARVERTREAFNRLLRDQVTTYLTVHEAVHRDAEWFARYVADYEAQLGGGPKHFDAYDELRPMLETMSRQGHSWYEVSTASDFWVRRELDGTAAQWREAMVALLSAYGEPTSFRPPAFPRSARP